MNIKILNEQLEGISLKELLSLIKIFMNNDIFKRLELSNDSQQGLQSDPNLKKLSKDKEIINLLDSVNLK